jgi:hypothetical protein
MFMMKPAATLIDRLAFEKAFLVVCILGSNSLGAEPEGSPLTLAKALALTLEKRPGSFFLFLGLPCSRSSYYSSKARS